MEPGLLAGDPRVSPAPDPRRFEAPAGMWPRNALCADVAPGVESRSALKSHSSGLTEAALPGFSEALLEDVPLPLVQGCHLLFSGGKGSLRVSSVQSLSRVRLFAIP